MVHFPARHAWLPEGMQSFILSSEGGIAKLPPWILPHSQPEQTRPAHSRKCRGGLCRSWSTGSCLVVRSQKSLMSVDVSWGPSSQALFGCDRIEYQKMSKNLRNCQFWFEYVLRSLCSFLASQWVGQTQAGWCKLEPKEKRPIEKPKAPKYRSSVSSSLSCLLQFNDSVARKRFEFQLESRKKWEKMMTDEKNMCFGGRTSKFSWPTELEASLWNQPRSIHGEAWVNLHCQEPSLHSDFRGSPRVANPMLISRESRVHIPSYPHVVHWKILEKVGDRMIGDMFLKMNPNDFQWYSRLQAFLRNSWWSMRMSCQLTPVRGWQRLHHPWDSDCCRKMARSPKWLPERKDMKGRHNPQIDHFRTWPTLWILPEKWW